MLASKDFISEQVVAGWLLVLSSLVFLVAGMLYTGRAIWKWPVGATHSYLIWERSFVIGALMVAVLGFTLLERMLEGSGDRILAPSGLVILSIAAGVVTIAETLFISRGELVYGPVIAFVVLAFLGQTFFGAALIRAGLLPAWVGWAAIIWNLGWLIVLPIARPQEMYYPWLHYVAPLMIGIALLLKR